jgi:outer membrane immunogenic protein
MKYRSLIAALGLLSISSAGAMAADLAYKAPPPTPPPPPSWTGFYIGINGGAGWATSESNLNVGGLLAGLGIPGIAANLPLSSHGLNGFLAGGQVGYNWQTGKFLLGIEGDGDWANIQGTTPCIVIFACTAKERWTADITARAGVLPMSDLLVYVKGGATWANMNYTFGAASPSLAAVPLR